MYSLHMSGVLRILQPLGCGVTENPTTFGQFKVMHAGPAVKNQPQPIVNSVNNSKM